MIDTTSDESFARSFREINSGRVKRLQESADSDLRSALLRDGVACVRGALRREEIENLLLFQTVTEQCLGGVPDCSGYISMSAQSVPGGLQIHGARLDRVHPNHGQVRLQTKGLNFPMPGFLEIASHPVIRNTFAWWHGDEGVVTRGTMEWIVPAELNHNGWHKDTVRPQLKAFILLGDVDEKTAPMYYARGSHMCSNRFEADIGRRLAVNGTSKIDPDVKLWGRHYPAVTGANSGYLGDDQAPNDPEQIDDDPVQLGDHVYHKTVCVGSLGDIVFFDSSGFHSGNRSHGKVRRTIALSSPDNRSDIAVALNSQGLSV